MSLLTHLGPVCQHLDKLKQILPKQFSLSTTQKVIIVSVTASVTVVGVLARYLRRKKRTVDLSKFKRPYPKRPRISGVRSPNGGLGDYSMTSGVAKADLFRQWQLIFGENLGGECNFGMTVRKYVVMYLRTECENTFFAHEHII
jgi:hypothetical protein